MYSDQKFIFVCVLEGHIWQEYNNELNNHYPHSVRHE